MKSALQMEAKIVDSIRPAKLLALYARGIITAPEFADGLLLALVEHDEPAALLPAALVQLPDEVRHNLDRLLAQIQRTGYQWRPFMLGPGGSIRGSAAEDAARLRQIGLR